MKCISLFTALLVLAAKSTAYPKPGIETTQWQPENETATLQWPSPTGLDIQSIIDELNSQNSSTSTSGIVNLGECKKLGSAKTKAELEKKFKLCAIEISKKNGNTGGKDLSNKDIWWILNTNSKNKLDFWQIIIRVITTKVQEKGKESPKGGLLEQLLAVVAFILNSVGKLLVGLNLTGKEGLLEDILKLVVDRLPGLLLPGSSSTQITTTAPVGGLLADVLQPVGGLLEQLLGGAGGAVENILGVVKNLIDRVLYLLSVLLFGPKPTWGKKDNEIIVGLIPGVLDLLVKILGKSNVDVLGGVLSKLVVLLNELITALLGGDIKTCVGKEALLPLLEQLLQDAVGAVKKLVNGLFGSSSSTCGADTVTGLIATILKGVGGILGEVLTLLLGNKSGSVDLGGLFGLLGDLLGGASKPQGGTGTGWQPGYGVNRSNPGGPEIPAGQPIIGTWFPPSGENGTSGGKDISNQTIWEIIGSDSQTKGSYNVGECKNLKNAKSKAEWEKIFKLCAIEISKKNGNTGGKDISNQTIWEIVSGSDSQTKADIWQIIIRFIAAKAEEKGKGSPQGGLVDQLLKLVLFILKNVGLLVKLDVGVKTGLIDIVLQLVLGRLPEILYPGSSTAVSTSPVGGLLAGIVGKVGGLLEALLGNGGAVHNIIGIVKSLLNQVLTFLGVLLFGKPKWGQKDNTYMIALIPGLLDFLVKILGQGTVDELGGVLSKLLVFLNELITGILGGNIKTCVGKEGLLGLLGQFLQDVVGAVKKLLAGLFGSSSTSCGADDLSGLLATILKGVGGILGEVLTLLLGNKSGSVDLSLGGLFGLVGDLLGGAPKPQGGSGTGGLGGLVGDLLGGAPKPQGISGKENIW